MSIFDSLELTEHISFFVPGVPVGKQRARTSTRGAKVRHYTPDKTRNYESQVWHIASAAMHGPALSCPVYVDMVFFMPTSKSLRKWQEKLIEGHLWWPTTKPDADNMEKSIKDACNGIVWIDDSYVVGCAKLKRYADKNHPVGVWVNVKKVSGYSAQTKRVKIDSKEDIKK